MEIVRSLHAKSQPATEDSLAEPSSIYLDFHATTPIDPAVIEAMTFSMSYHVGNPHAKHHAVGVAAHDAITNARGQVAKLVGAQSSDVVFTSGATESNALAICGLERELKKRERRHILLSPLEHKSVLSAGRYLQKKGFEVSTLPVGKTGLVDVGEVLHAMKSSTGLVSVMMANNEIGTIQPIKEIGAICKERDVRFHCDAAQAAGRIPVSLRGNSIDFLTLSAHKMYGPKGIGALIVSAQRRKELRPLVEAGTQEYGLRPGTLPTFLCVGFGQACKIASSRLRSDSILLKRLAKRFLADLSRRQVAFQINGCTTSRLPGSLNLSFPGVMSDALLLSVSSALAMSSGSACTSSTVEGSHVLSALALPESRIRSAIRLSFGRTSSEGDATCAASIVADSVRQLLSVHKELS